jgi:hypothetical protein
MDRLRPCPLPAGGARGSPGPPGGVRALGGGAAIYTGARQPRQDAPIRPGPAQRDPTFRGGERRGQTAAAPPLPAGGARGSPGPPGGARALGGRAGWSG